MDNKKEVLNVQPHSIDAEQAVLGSMLTDKDAVNKAFEKKLSSEHFYKKSHSLIFTAINQITCSILTIVLQHLFILMYYH